MDVFPLNEADVRAMVRLLADVCAHPGDHAEKKRLLMEGMCAMVDADAWVWGLAAEMDPKKLPVYVGFHHGGFDEAMFAQFLKVQTHADMIWVTERLSQELSEAGAHLTRTLQQIVPEERFMQSDVRHLWEECGIYPRCLSLRPAGGSAFTGIALYRRVGKPLFSEREARIAHILMTEVPWLHEQGWPEDRGAKVPRLSPRQRLVLEMLLQSYSRKAIAGHLGISLHTVGGYAKELYRHFKVCSHAELLRRFYHGDGGHQQAGVPKAGTH